MNTTYRCSKCGYRLPGESDDPPVIQFACQCDRLADFVRDLNGEELIELHALLAERRSARLAERGTP